MDDLGDASIPSLSSGEVGSRFVTESDITSARETRNQEWKAAYARLGQEPPPLPKEDVYDGRSLAEKLAANKAAKQEEWEERNKLSKQFRALEEDEVLFLDTMAGEKLEEERKRKLEEGENLKGFREAVAARLNTERDLQSTQASSHPISRPLRSPAGPSAGGAKKKPTLKGVQIRKKASLKPTGDGLKPDNAETYSNIVTKRPRLNDKS